MTTTAELRPPSPHVAAPPAGDDGARARTLLIAELRALWRDLCADRRAIDKLIAEIEAAGNRLKADRSYTARDAFDHFGPGFIIWLSTRKLDPWWTDGG